MFQSPSYPEPPTSSSLAYARSELDVHRQSLQDIATKIQAAEDTLARIVRDSRATIHEFETQRNELEHKVALALSYISPIRRLPLELLRLVFLIYFEECPCCAWILSAVSRSWRAMVLSMPILWSKIRLVTTESTSADTIRLWLERSGPKIPLDIEIFLKSSPYLSSVLESISRRRTPISGFPSLLSDPWGLGTDTWTSPPGLGGIHGGAAGASATTTYVVVTTPTVGNPVQVLATPNTSHLSDETWALPPILPAAERLSSSFSNPASSSSSQTKTKKNTHWGHIAFFYLVEQMHRWERFVFRYDKQFSSSSALKAIEGDAPLLKEFEIACAEPTVHSDWKWLPSAPSNAAIDISQLRSLTLQNVPFKWSSPIFRNLRSLTLRALPTVHLSLDRILYVLAANPQLTSLSLHFVSPNPPVLPLSPTTLPHLRSLSIGGHYLLSTLVDSLVLPALDSVVLDIDAREPVEDTVTSLLTRSSNPPLSRLSLSYGLNPVSNSGLYYGAGAGVTSWHFLGELDHLRTLQVGGIAFEPLLTMLGAPDSDDGLDHWLCPNLVKLAMRDCHTHGDGVAKLVHMVDARNPELGYLHASSASAGSGANSNSHSHSGSGPGSGSAAAPARLKHLELYSCAPLGPDVIKWLKTRVDEVICTEPAFDGCVLRSSF